MHFNIKGILIRNGLNLNVNLQPQIYISLYDALKKAILTRSLEPGSKLPPSRILAKDLDISRSTVLKAFDLLLVERYIKSIKGSGYYVLSPKDKKLKLNFTSVDRKGNYPQLSLKGKAFSQNVTWTDDSRDKGVAFRPGLPPLDIFPVQLWKKLIGDYWRCITPSELSYSNTIGLRCLRENLANYLRVYRDIHCNPDQIIVTTGSLHSLYLVSNVLLETDDEVVVENPTYPMAHSLFKSLGAKICASDVDHEGLCLKGISCNSPKFVYTTPSSQYPTGIKMSMERRADLLKWASAKETFIVEDDYNHEFSNWEKPLGSLFGMDKQERVIYLGTFNKLIHPSMRLGYMIVPYYLLDAVIALYQQSSRFVSRQNQKAMSAFIEKDHLNKHLRNVIDVSNERKEVFVEHFNEVLGAYFDLDTSNPGLHVIAHIAKEGFKDIQLEKVLKDNNILAHALSKYYVNHKGENGLVMGFSCVNPKQIRENLNKMERVISEFLK